MLTAGEAMGAVRADGMVRHGPSAHLSVAGAESNVAIGLARLGHRARWVGVLGDDQFGALVLRTLRAEGVDTESVRVHPAPTGVLVSEPRVAGLARVDYHRAGSAGSLLSADDIRDALTPEPRILHLTGVTPALGEGPASAVRTAATAAAERGITVSLDVNYRRTLWTADQARATLGPLVGTLDIVFASEGELALIAPDGADLAGRVKSLLAVGVTTVVVKRGPEGASAYTSEGVVDASARPVTAVDPIGAGDAFVAGYLSCLLDGLPLQERLARATTVAAFVVASHGDWEGLPTRTELPMLDRPPGDVVR
ncbi:MAG: sugar kinase [Nocardioidaceae bacterium]